MKSHGRIEAPHFVAGLTAIDSRVTVAAPIIRYMLGWTEDRVSQYARSKKWFVQWEPDLGGKK